LKSRIEGIADALAIEAGMHLGSWKRYEVDFSVYLKVIVEL